MTERADPPEGSRPPEGSGPSEGSDLTEGSEVTEPTDQAPSGPTARVEVVGGGTPDAGQLAAIVVALTPTGGGDEPEPAAPAWARAALLENVGHRRPQRPSDLDATLRLG